MPNYRRPRKTINPYDIVQNQHTVSAENQTPAVGDEAFILSVFDGKSPEGARTWTVTRVSPTGRMVTITAADDSAVVVKLTRRFDGTFRHGSISYVAFAPASA